MKSLQPSRSPKKATLVPMTGPKSMSTGASAVRQRGEELRERLRRDDDWLGPRERGASRAGVRHVGALAAPAEEV